MIFFSLCRRLVYPCLFVHPILTLNILNVENVLYWYGFETTVGTKQLVTSFHMIGILQNCPFKPSLVVGGLNLSLG